MFIKSFSLVLKEWYVSVASIPRLCEYLRVNHHSSDDYSSKRTDETNMAHRTVFASTATQRLQTWKLVWTGNEISDEEFKSSTYSRYIFGEPRLWPDDNHPTFLLISRLDHLHQHLPVATEARDIVRAPAHYQAQVLCLLGDVALAVAIWNQVNCKNSPKWQHVRSALGVWLKYQTLARDKVFDEIRQSLGDRIFFSPLDRHSALECMKHVRLPTLDEWVVKRNLGIHWRDPHTFTPHELTALSQKQIPDVDLHLDQVSASDLETLYHGNFEDQAIQNLMTSLVMEPWVEHYSCSWEPDGLDWTEKLVCGEKLSFWRRETASSLQAMMLRCQEKLRETTHPADVNQ
jgi:hypothetical protein